MEERSADPILQHGKSPASGKRQMIKVTVQPGGHQIKLRIWSSTLEVKQQLGEASSVPVSWMRLLHNNVELLNSQLLIDLVPNVRQPRRGASDGSRGQGSSPSRSLTFWLKVRLRTSSPLAQRSPSQTHPDAHRAVFPAATNPPHHPSPSAPSAGAKPARF